MRDVVSDADKLEAIGASGLQRCFDYNIAAQQESGAWSKLMECGERRAAETVFTDVVQHCDEKLLLLARDFIATTAGKFLAAPRHNELVETLEKWKRDGPPQLKPHQQLFR